MPLSKRDHKKWFRSWDERRREIDQIWGVLRRNPGWEETIDKWVHIKIMGKDASDEKIPRYSTTGQVMKVVRRVEGILREARLHGRVTYVSIGTSDRIGRKKKPGWYVYIDCGGVCYNPSNCETWPETFEMAFCRSAIEFVEGREYCTEQNPVLAKRI